MNPSRLHAAPYVTLRMCPPWPKLNSDLETKLYGRLETSRGALQRMARPRKVSDDEVFAAAMRAMSRVGPGELTLALIAEEAGVTAGALVQRFGSRRQLLVTMSALL